MARCGTTSGLKQPAHHELRVVDKEKDRQEHFKTEFDFSVNQQGGCEITVGAQPL